MPASLLPLLVSLATVSAIEVASAPAEMRSANGTGGSPWRNVDAARCDTTQAAAAECYARSTTEVLEARGFDFGLPEIDSVEARWTVGVYPVPADGWRLAALSAAWRDGFVDLAEPPPDAPYEYNASHVFRDENVLLVARILGSPNWSDAVLRIAFASTNEDATFLVSCVEARASSSWEPPPPIEPIPFPIDYPIFAGIALALIFAAARRARRRRSIAGRDDDAELVELSPALFVDDVQFEEGVEDLADHPFASEKRACVVRRENCSAFRLRQVGDRERFQRLRSARHPNLATFFGLYDAGGRGFFAIWSRPAIDLNSWRRDREPCAADSLRICQAAACALEGLERHIYPHGDVACRNMIVEEDGRLALTGAGLARDHDVRSYLSRGDDPGCPLRWMAPEAIRGGVVDLATDRWSFGVLAWEACSAPGSLPRASATPREIVDRPYGLPKLERPEHAHEDAWAAIEPCLNPDRDARPSMRVVRDALLALSEVAGHKPQARDEECLPLVRERGGKFEMQVHKK